MIGRDFFDVVDAEDAPQSRDTLRRFSTGEINRLTLEMRKRHGAEGHVAWLKISITSSPGPDGLPLYLSYVVEDISERKAVAIELQMREEKYSTVIATATEGFWLVDMTGQLLEVNIAYYRLCGYTVDLENAGLRAMLETLGPAVVGPDFSIQTAAEHIMWVKMFNADQICTNIDYVFIPEGTQDAFVGHCKLLLPC